MTVITIFLNAEKYLEEAIESEDGFATGTHSHDHDNHKPKAAKKDDAKPAKAKKVEKADIEPAAGGFVLALFAPLNRLVEFVLQEPQYRADMMREIDSRYWIAPTLSPPDSFLEPLQNGGVRSMGVHKPWSPSRSYGLVATLDGKLQPVTSYHSRANGRFHGVTSAIAVDGAILAASKGGNHIIRLAPAEGDL